MAQVGSQVLGAVQLPEAALLRGEIEVTALLRDAAIEGLLLAAGGLGVVGSGS
jgi:hypothetical protein